MALRTIRVNGVTFGKGFRLELIFYDVVQVFFNKTLIILIGMQHDLVH